jgi:hypothetical protein
MQGNHLESGRAFFGLRAFTKTTIANGVVLNERKGTVKTHVRNFVKDERNVQISS